MGTMTVGRLNARRRASETKPLCYDLAKNLHSSHKRSAMGPFAPTTSRMTTASPPAATAAAATPSEVLGSDILLSSRWLNFKALKVCALCLCVLGLSNTTALY